MEDADWTDAENRTVGVLLKGSGMQEIDIARGSKGAPGNTLLLLCNTSHVGVPFFLPEHSLGDSWKILIDTSEKIAEPIWQMETELPLKARSVVLLELHDSKTDSKPEG
ncbi:MAG TPA: hypothetical protein V6C97_05310 [Oculatellaceae cyanobacterium]